MSITVINYFQRIQVKNNNRKNNTNATPIDVITNPYDLCGYKNSVYS